MAPLFLLSCVKQKLSEGAPAKDIYISDWFKKARTYVEKQKGEWRILSAKYTLLHPDTFIQPYEHTLQNLPRGEYIEWLYWVLRILDREFSPLKGRRVVILAGDLYRADIVPWLEYKGASLETPLKGLGIGEQLHWLKERAR